LTPALLLLQGLPSTLHDAAKIGNEAALKRLIEEGADVNEKDGRGITPLGVAVGFNRIPCVKALLAAGANVRLADARGSTVLHYAAGL
jgi:ankyrin repeat protein